MPPRTTRLRRRGRPRYASYVADRGYQEWVRSQGCVIGTGCLGVVQAHHVDTRGHGGHDRKNLAGLCVGHHDELHTSGRVSFARKHGVNLTAIAETLWRDYQRGSE
jgi:hypothetical protein